MDDKLSDLFVDLRMALKRLQADQGDRARKNARDAVLYALRKLRRDVDARFPKPRKAAKRNRRKLSRDLAATHVPVPSDSGYTERCEKARVRIVDVGKQELRWIPIWAKRMIESMATIRELSAARRRPSERRAFMAEVALATMKEGKT